MYQSPAPAPPAHERKYRFPWRPGNCFELLVDGGRYFPAMLEAIAAARSHVLLEMYLVGSGSVARRFMEALGAAAERGVVVCLLLDHFGALGLSLGDRAELQRRGVRLVFYNPLRLSHPRRGLLRDHRKLLVVDGTTAFVGGTGITDDFDAGASRRPWHDVVVRVTGPVVADWQTLFVSNWNRWNSHLTPVLPPPEPLVEGAAGRVVVVRPGPGGQEIKRSLINQLRLSRRRVWICTAYFVPSRKLLRALRRAVRRGVDVRLLLPGPYTDHPAVRHAGRRYYQRLLRARVRLFEYQPRVLHGKVVLCDDWVSIGSCNIDRWNLRWNLEANQEVRDPAFAAAVVHHFEGDFRKSLEITPLGWPRRPLRQRFRERLWGWADLWLERLRQPPGPPA